MAFGGFPSFPPAPPPAGSGSPPGYTGPPILNSPPTAAADTNATVNSIVEGAAVNTLVGITAHATDPEGQTLTYSLGADSSGGGFKIDPATGVVRVANPAKIDFETAAGHAYTITVVTSDGYSTSSQNFIIGVADVAPSTPVDSNAAADTVVEGAATNTLVGITAASTDVNGPGVTWSLSADSSAGGFKIDAVTGVISVADATKIDYETSAGHAYTVTARASDGTLSSSQNFTIAVSDVALTTPVDSNAAANSVAEGAAYGTTVGVTASAFDPNGPKTVYTLIGDTSGGGFAVNSVTGVVAVINAAKIDYESSGAGHSYTVTVQASNGLLTKSQSFTIGVTDVAPSKPVDSNLAANTVVEGAANGSAVGVTASSTDVNGPAVTYSLTSDSSAGGFTINAATGIITVADHAKINYETAAGHAYTVTARASDGTLSSSQTFTIAVTDIAPSKPVDSNLAVNAVNEGAAAGTQTGITASSTDINGPGVTYSLVGDTSGGGFTVNATTGVVTVANGAKIDYETSPGHAYTVTVQASDGTLTNSQAFTIAVNDLPPNLAPDGSGADNTVVEGAANGTTVGVTVAALDASGGHITYSLTDNAGGRFTIDANTGVVTVLDHTKIDFETSGPTHAYIITAQASDGTLTTSQNYQIQVTDVAPSAPTDSNGATNTVVEGAANNSAVGITASSTDVNGPAVTYSLTSDSSVGGFKIDAATGIITVADANKINYETAPGHAYTVTARASDGTLSSSQNFTIAVTNTNPTTPTDGDSATANKVAEGAAAGTYTGLTASASDVNGPAVTWSITADSSNGAFAIDSTGKVTVANAAKLNYETAGEQHKYTITVQASDGAGGTSSQSFDIGVTNTNPTVPVDSDTAHADTVAEGALAGTYTGITASASDVNGPAVNWSLSADSSLGGFAIDSTGKITVANAALIDFETSGASHSYTVTAQASDGGGGFSSKTFTIGVTDVAPSTPTDSNGAGSAIAEGAANGSTVGITAFSTEINGPAVVYSLTDNAGGRFAIDSATGVVTVANGALIDYETAAGHAYGITVKATGGALSSSSNFSIGVINVNEAPSGTDKAVSITEDNTYVFGVADFALSDPGDTSAPNSLLAVKITTLPGAADGTLTNGGVAVNAGDFISLNDLLAGHLVFTPAPDANGAPEATFSFQVQDNGGTLNGGVDLDQSPNIFTINVNAGNDAPVNSVPGIQSVDEDATLTFSTNAGNAITISDVDVGSGNETVTLTVASGTLALGSHAGLVSFSPDNAASITLTGTIANINAAMNGLTYTGNLDFNGQDTLKIATSDNGNTGAGGPQSDNDTVTINVAAVNDAPINSIPANQAVNEDTALVLSSVDGTAIKISDVDVGAGTETVSLQVGSGVLTLNGTSGLAFTVGDGAADNTMTFTGTVADINAALNGLTYQGNLNYNGPDTLSITTVDNGNTGSGGTKIAGNILSINVDAVNDAPTATNLTQSLILDEDAAATPLFTAAPVVADVDSATVTTTLTLDAAAGVLLGAGAGVLAGGILTYTITGSPAAMNAALAAVTFDSAQDFNGAASVGVTVDDGLSGPQGSNPTGTVSITVNAVNDAPTATNLTQSLILNEDAAATTLFTTAPVVADVDSPTVTAKLTLDAAAGELLGAGTGVLVAGVLTYTITGDPATVNAALAAVTFDSAQDFNGAASVGVTVGDGLSGPQGANPTGTVSITVNPVNDAPTATNLTQSLTLNEDAAATTLFTVAPVVADVDSPTVTATLTLDAAAGVLLGAGAGVLAAGVLTYTITGAPAAVNAALAAVAFGSAQDFNGTTNVGVTVDDGLSGPQGGNPTGTVSITVNAVNDAPALTAHDRDPAYAAGVQLFDSTSVSVGPVDEAAQKIDQLVLTVSHVSNIAAREHLSIDGTNVDLVNGTTTTTSGLTALVSVSGGTATVTISEAGGISAGAVQTLVDGLTYTNTLVGPGELSRDVTIVSLHDTGGISPGVDTGTPGIVSTVNFNLPPSITAGDTINYVENDAATVIDSSITITDPDDTNMEGATVRISSGFAAGQDVLSFTPVGAITGSFVGDTLTLQGTGTIAEYKQVLESVKYANSSDDPSTADRVISYVVNDGSVNSTPSTATIHVAARNDEPTLTATAINPAFTENGSPVDLFSAPAASAIEAGQNLDQLVLTVSNVAGTGAAESLLIDGTTVSLTNGNSIASTTTNGMAVSVALAAGTATVTISKVGGVSAAAINTLVDALAYGNSSEDPGNASRVVTLASLRDTGLNGGGDDNIHTGLGIASTVTVTPVNDAPTLTTTGLNPGFTENGAAVDLFSTPVVASAIEAGQNLNTLVVTVTNVAGTGATESLTIDGTVVELNNGNSETTLTNGMTAAVALSFGTATVTISHAGGVSAATMQTIVDGLAYGNSSDDPGAATRVVTITSLSDNGPTGGADHNTTTLSIASSVAVTPVNDAPVVDLDSTVAGTQTAATTATFSEGAGPPSTAVNVVPHVHLSDADSASLTGATVTLTDAVAGQDVLTVSGTSSGDIGAVHYSVSGNTVTFSNTASATAYETAIQAVQYNNTSENPAPGARHFDIQATDGTTASTTATATVNVVGQNDAPVNTVPLTANLDAAFSNTAFAITGLDVADVDSGAGLIRTTLQVDNGGLSVSLAVGTAIVGGVNGSGTVTIEGTAAAIHNTLANNVVYKSSDGFTGTATVSVSTTDQGNSGLGGALVDNNDSFKIGVVPQVWYIDGAAVGPGTAGTAADPFHTIAAFNSSLGPGVNDYIVIKSGTYSDGLNLKDGQQVYGAGETLSFTNPAGGHNVAILDGTGTRPTISVTTANDQGIDLASGNTIHGVNITTGAGTSGLDDGNNSVGTLTIDHMAISGAGQAVDIDQGGALNVTLESVSSTGGAQGIQLGTTVGGTALTGTFSGGTGAISGSTVAGILVGDGAGGASTGGTAVISYAGTISAGTGVNDVNVQDHATGAVTLSGNLTHTGGSGGAIVLDGNSSSFTFSGTTNNLTTGSSNAINITNQTGSTTVGFSGALNIDTTSGTGVNLGGSNGANTNFNFSGSNLTIDTTGGNGFVATGGGTVSVTGTGNHINSGSGTALNISNTTIGVSNVTFQDISSNGGSANGIILDTTGSAGGLHVTGVSAAGSGGTIANKSGADGSTTQGTGIYLNNTSDVELNHMQLNNFQNFGIRGFGVNGFTLANSVVNATSGTNGTSTGADEGSISFRAASPGPGATTNGLIGTVNITNSTIANGLEDNFNVFNNSGSLNITVTGSTFRDSGNDALLLESDNTANITGLITNSSFLRNFARGVQVISNGSGNIDVDVGQAGVAGSGGTFTDNFVGTDFDQNGSGTFNFNVLNASFTTANYAALFGAGGAGSQINVNRGGATTPVARGLFTGNIDNNTINNADSGTGPGISVSVNGTGTGSNTTTVKIDGNNVSHVGSYGILLSAGDGNGILNATVTNNTVSTTTAAALQAIRVNGGISSSQAGAPGTPDNGTVNFDIHGNALSVDPLAGVTDIRVRQRFNYTDKIEGFGGSATDDSAVAAYLAGLNTHIGGGAATVAADHNNSGFGTLVAVTEPPAPLFAAAGGVQASSPNLGEMHLSQSELDWVVSAAIAQWTAAGASATQIAALNATTFSIADLAGSTVGLESAPAHITIDINAAGHGWFVDPTPASNSEFMHAANAAGTDLFTDPTNAAAGHLDLLTTVSHELGHVLGLPDSTNPADVHDLMYISLVDGERRLPGAADVAQADPAPPAASLTPAVSIGPVPAPSGSPGPASGGTFDAGHGGGTLVGTAGADNFVFAHVDVHAAAAPPVTYVANYSFAEGDTFDFSALTASFHGWNVADTALVRAVEDPSGSFATLQVNTTTDAVVSNAHWVNVAQITGAHAGDAVNVTIDSHSAAHLAQIHVGLLV
jgi:hypothetical protein